MEGKREKKKGGKTGVYIRDANELGETTAYRWKEYIEGIIFYIPLDIYRGIHIYLLIFIEVYIYTF